MLALFLHFILPPYTLKFPMTNLLKYYVRWLILFLILLSVKCIAIGKKRAYWVKKGESKNTTYNVNQIKNGLIFLINNAYFRINNDVFHQVIGIPMRFSVSLRMPMDGAFM